MCITATGPPTSSADAATCCSGASTNAAFTPARARLRTWGRGTVVDTRSTRRPLAGPTRRSGCRCLSASSSRPPWFCPQLILISAGFDGHSDDPLASCVLETDSYAQMTAHAIKLAARVGAPVGAVLEGGSGPGALADSVLAMLGAFGGQARAEPIAPHPLHRRAAPRRRRPHPPRRLRHRPGRRPRPQERSRAPRPERPGRAPAQRRSPQNRLKHLATHRSAANLGVGEASAP